MNKNDTPKDEEIFVLTEKQVTDRLIYYSTKTSEIIRQLCLAGLAISWLFLYDSKGKVYDPKWLIPTGFFILAVIADLLQYHYASSVYMNAKSTGESFTFSKKERDRINKLFRGKKWITLIAYLILAVMILADVFNK